MPTMARRALQETPPVDNARRPGVSPEAGDTLTLCHKGHHKAAFSMELDGYDQVSNMMLPEIETSQQQK